MSGYSGNDYLDGMADCKAGKKHEKGRSVEYDKGYAAQFQHEQNLTEISLQQERLRGK